MSDNNISFQDIENLCKEYGIKMENLRKRKDARIKSNIKGLMEKGTELNKHIPDELLVTEIADIPRGRDFFDKYSEWFM